MRQQGCAGEETIERTGQQVHALETQGGGNTRMIRESLFDQMRRIPEDLQETHERLMNWAAWSKDRIRKGHCRSIEYRYKSSDVWQDTEPRIEWDSLAAEALHSHVCALPEKHRWLLNLHCVHRAPEGYIRRVLVIGRDDLVYEFQRAMRMVRNAAHGLVQQGEGHGKI
jgi:hypothetical protein